MRSMTAILPPASTPTPIRTYSAAAREQQRGIIRDGMAPACASSVTNGLHRVCPAASAPLWSAAPPEARIPRRQQRARDQVVDIFDEVDEELRAERARRLLKQYSGLIVAVALLIVGAAAGWQG